MVSGYEIEKESQDKRSALILVTSSAPYGMSEVFFQAEVSQVNKACDVLLTPVWPRGERQPWPGRVLVDDGRPRCHFGATLRALCSSPELRRLLVSSIRASDIRTSAKCFLASFVGLRWAFEVELSGLDICHVHATTIGAPSAAAAMMAQHLAVDASPTAHRGDISHHASRRSLNHLKVIRAISKRAAGQLTHHGFSSTVIPLGSLSAIGEALPPENRMGLRCVVIGSLFPVKGHIRAIRMVADLRDCGIDVQLEFVGDGPLSESLRTEIGRLGVDEYVELVGVRPHEELLAELAGGRWNVLVQPSIQDAANEEGIPVAVLEAAAAGLAIVAADSGATSEFLRDEVNGLLISATDEVKAISMGVAALTRLAKSESLRSQLARRAQADAYRFLASRTVAELTRAITGPFQERPR